MKSNDPSCHVAPEPDAEPVPLEHPSNGPEPIRIELEARDTNWEVAPGVTISGYGYNGQVPGPIIEARQGTPLEIRFTNNLPEPTLIHCHLGSELHVRSTGRFSARPVLDDQSPQ